jgi:hypothetical protein
LGDGDGPERSGHLRIPATRGRSFLKAVVSQISNIGDAYCVTQHVVDQLTTFNYFENKS